jgi:hypothetical protein
MSVEEDFEPISHGIVKNKILHVLGIYPQLSQSMLQVGIGTALSSKIWLPVLEQLKAEGIVKVEEKQARSPSGRDQTYQIISLSKLPE